jgi:hypothetical protein
MPVAVPCHQGDLTFLGRLVSESYGIENLVRALLCYASFERYGQSRERALTETLCRHSQRAGSTPYLALEGWLERYCEARLWKLFKVQLVVNSCTDASSQLSVRLSLPLNIN